jgi:hypothetical protein
MADTTDVRGWAETRKAFIAWLHERRDEALRLLEDDLSASPRYYFEQNSSQYATEFYTRIDRWRRWFSSLTTGLHRRVQYADHFVADATARFAEQRLLVFNIHDFNDPSIVQQFDLRDRVAFSNGAGWSHLGQWFRAGREEPAWNHVRQTLATEVRAFSSMLLEQMNDLNLVPLEADAESAEQPVPPQSVPVDETDRFTSVERRGDGAHASVWRAHDNALNRIVALRVVRSSAGGSQEAIAHARTMAKPPPHTNIVAVYELVSIRDPADTQTHVVAAVMEFVDGEKLSSVCKRQLSVGLAVRVCNGILAALEHYHAHGFAHLDLHADNVLVTQPGDPKILDPRTYRTEMFATTQRARDQLVRDVRDATFLLRTVLTSSDFGPSIAVRFHELANDAESVTELVAALAATTANATRGSVQRPRTQANSETNADDSVAVLSAALELARANDQLGWRELENQVRRNFLERIVPWRATHEPAWRGDRDKNGCFSTADSLVQLAMPRVVLALAGVYSRNPALADQRRILDDLTWVPGWSPGGTVAIVQAPRALVYLLHHLHGALSLSGGDVDPAIEFAQLMAPGQQNDKARSLWRHHDLIGWPKLLGGNNRWAWEYLCDMRRRQPALERLFALPTDFDVGLASYSMVLSLLELAHDAARAKPTDLSNTEGIRLDVPPLFVGSSAEIIGVAARRTFGNRHVVEAIASRMGAKREVMQQLWPHWTKLMAKTGLDVFEQFFVDELPLGELA